MLVDFHVTVIALVVLLGHRFPMLLFLVGQVGPLDRDLLHEVRVAHVRIILLPLISFIPAVEKEGSLRLHGLHEFSFLLGECLRFHFILVALLVRHRHILIHSPLILHEGLPHLSELLG